MWASVNYILRVYTVEKCCNNSTPIPFWLFNIFYLIFFFLYREEIYCDNKTESAIAGGNEIPAAVRSRVRPHFRFEAKFEIEAKISFRLCEAKKKPDFT